MRILQLEGNAKEHEIIRKELHRIGISHVVSVKSVEECIRYLEEDRAKVDVILADLYLPIRMNEKSDWNAGALLIRELERRWITIPVVTISSAWMQLAGAYASIWFVNSRDWEAELRCCLKQIARETYQYL